MALAAAVCTVLYWRMAALGGRFSPRSSRRQHRPRALMIFGLDRVSNRLDDFSAGSLERLDHGAAEEPSGPPPRRPCPIFCRGNRRRLFPRSLSDVYGSAVGRADRVHPCGKQSVAGSSGNGTGRRRSDGGGNCFVRVLVRRRPAGVVAVRVRTCTAAIAGGLAASAAHSLVDFIWYVPGCMAMTFLLAACALRVREAGKRLGARDIGSQPGDRARDFFGSSRTISFFPNSQVPILRIRLAWTAAAVLVLGLGIWMVADRVGPAVAQTYWDQYFVARNVANVWTPTDPNPTAADPRCRSSGSSVWRMSCDGSRRTCNCIWRWRRRIAGCSTRCKRRRRIRCPWPISAMPRYNRNFRRARR